MKTEKGTQGKHRTPMRDGITKTAEMRVLFGPQGADFVSPDSFSRYRRWQRKEIPRFTCMYSRETERLIR